MSKPMLERHLPLKVITDSSIRKRRFKISIFILFIFGLILFAFNYSFPAGLSYDAATPLKIYNSLKSDTNNNHPSIKNVAEFGQLTSTPKKFDDRFNINATASPLSSSTNSSKRIGLDFCNLPDVDPWDPSIIEFIQPQKDHVLGCTRKVYEHSKLINGQLFIYSNKSSVAEMNCRMRCLFPKGDWNIMYGKWTKVLNGTKPKCDIIEVECHLAANDGENGDPYYKYLHAQIYRNPVRLPPSSSIPKPPEKYDVHIIVLDSVAQTQFIRLMPKTMYMLLDQYEAIPFHHLNKVGLNSHPNAFAFLLGKMELSIPESPFSRGYSGDYKNDDEACRTPLDNEQFIGFRFKDDGYITMMADDWQMGVLMWPNCDGFKKTPMDHYMQPFQNRLDHSQYLSPNMKDIIHKNSCRESYHDVMEYLKSFLEAYPDKPKFSMTWMTYLTHDDENALSSSDDYFYHFFKDTVKDFENSFLFIMGDHGLRYGDVRETTVGEIEDDNPALFLSVPKPLRDNPYFMQQLRTNSKELITHFDIYATLNEIAQPKNPRIPNPLLHGSSLFHPLPSPRTCDSLRIPLEYCKCHANKTILPKDNKIGIKAAKLMVEQMNHNLTSSNETSKVCSKLSLNENAEIIVEDYGGEQSIRGYKITFSTLPGNGKFWGAVAFDPSNQEIQIASPKFMRLNSYDEQAQCAIESDLASYCYCYKHWLWW